MPLSVRNTVVILLMLLGGILWPHATQAQIIKPSGRVTDLVNVLSTKDNLHLTQTLSQYEHETTHQIAVLIVPSLSGESIDSFSLRTANAWGLGRKGIDNGILVVLAPNQRKVRIELGRGFERYISNSKAQEIINKQMLPAFRHQQYSRGLELGLQQLMQEGRNFHAPR